jgi:hypothetical protein
MEGSSGRLASRLGIVGGVLLALAASALADPGSALVPPLAPADGAGPIFAGCPVFPTDDPWNQDVSDRPVDPASASLIAAIGRDAPLRLGFGAEEEFYGTPVTVVPPDQPPATIAYGTDGLDYSHESDRGPFPVPLDAPIQGGSDQHPDPSGGDRHVVVVQTGTCRAFELFNAVRIPGGFRVTSSVWWDLRSSPSRPPGWTSADGAGLPILPGLVRWDEASSGTIRHALRFTAPRVRNAWVPPANHCGPHADPALPPFGARVRLRADFDVSGYGVAGRTILEALKRHGMILADVGTAWTLGGTSDPGFAEAIRELRDRPVPGSAFEVVELGPLRTDC